MEIIWIASMFTALGGYYVGHRIGYQSGAYDALMINSYHKELAEEPCDLLDAKSRLSENDDEIDEIEEILWNLKKK